MPGTITRFCEKKLGLFLCQLYLGKIYVFKDDASRGEYNRPTGLPPVGIAAGVSYGPFGLAVATRQAASLPGSLAVSCFKYWGGICGVCHLIVTFNPW